MTPKFAITFGHIDRDVSQRPEVAVLVGGETVALLQRDTTASAPEWYTLEGTTRVGNELTIDIPDCDWDARLADAKKWIGAHIRGQIKAHRP